MTYPYVFSVRRGSLMEYPSTYHLQFRNSDLSLEQEVSVEDGAISYHTFAVDSRGHVFFQAPNYYFYHYDNNGNLICKQYIGGATVSSYNTQIAANGYLLWDTYNGNRYRTQIEGHDRGVKCFDVVPMSLNLTSNKAHQRIAVDSNDADIFYAFNTMDNAMEKWSISDANKLNSFTLTVYPDFETKGHGMEVLGSYIYAPYLRTINNHDTGLIWRMSTALNSNPEDVFYIEPDSVTMGDGEGEYIVNYGVSVARALNGNLLVTFISRAYDDEDEEIKGKHYYIRIYSPSGSQIGSTVDMGSAVYGETTLSMVTPGSYFVTDETLPTVETLEPVNIYKSAGKLYGDWKLNLINSENTYDIGWYYDEECSTEGAGWKYYNYNNPTFYSNGEYQKQFYLTDIEGGYWLIAYARNSAGEAIGEGVKFIFPQATLETLAAERIIGATSTDNRIRLNGEITEINGEVIQRGFEYLIQDEEPEIEDSGTEILEEKEEGYSIGEYYLDVRELYELESGKEDWEETTIWWFRAICYAGGVKYSGDWMKNVPTVETGDMNNLLVLNSIPVVEAHGELIDKGANIVTKRGFRIIKEYQGDLFCADFYIGIAFGNFKVMEELESHTILGGADGYTVVDYYWTGKFYRDSVEEGNFALGEFIRELGGGMGFEGFGIYLKQNDTYLIQAIAKNNLGWGFGEQKSVTTLGGEGDGTGEIDVDITDNKLDSTKFEKTVTIGTVPTGCQVTRVGIRLGRTKGCNELHYYEDGSWGSGESVTFMVELEPNSTYYIMPYIVMNYGGYEEEILGMLGYTDPDNEEEYLSKYPVEIVGELEDEPTTSAQTGEGNYSYRSINQEITCEKIGHQGLIDYYGRRRAYTVNNHLIQKKDVCCLVISNYLDNFQRLKLKVAIDIDMPIPFQEQDTILLGDGKVLFKADTQGIVLFKNDGQGELKQQSFILAKIRKLGATYVSGGSTIIPMELEV